MTRVALPIATGFYEGNSSPVASQQCVNFFVQVPQTNALSEAQLVGTPGIKSFATAGTKAARNSHVMNGIKYSVNGTTLYRVNADGTSDDLGTISGVGRVSMADNGTQLCIVVPGSVGYIFTESPDTLTQITDPEFTTNIGPSEQVVFKDGYFIHFNSSSASGTGVVFFISNLNNGLAYDALDFGSAEADPDAITGIHVNKNILYVAGEITTEPQQNVGVIAGDFPFQRIQGGLIQKGVKAKFSMIDFDNGFAFVGAGENENPSVWKASGGSSVKISSSAIDNEIRKLTDDQQKSIFSTADTVGGGYFLNVHFPDKVFSYDSLASSLSGRPIWFERRSKDEFGRFTTWRVNSIVHAYGKTLVTDNQSGSIGELDIETFTEYGTDITAFASTKPFSNLGSPLSVGDMELTCEAGVGNIVDPGSDPVVTREFSDDGGNTFIGATDRKLGKIGEYKARQIWRRGGQFQNTRSYRFTMAGPFKKVIIKLEADIL